MHTKKVALIGSTQYEEKMKLYTWSHRNDGWDIKLPFFDSTVGVNTSGLTMMERNLELIKWADEIHIFWDGRSIGTWGDFCMAFALKKKVQILFLEPKSCRNIIKQYEEKCLEAKTKISGG